MDIDIKRRIIEGLRPLVLRLVYSDNLLRILFITILVSYFPWGSLIPLGSRNEVLAQMPQGSECGMGGGLFAGDSALSETQELLGVFESQDLSQPRMLTYTSYTLESGDIIGNIAVQTGLNEDTLISINNIRNTRLMQIGQVIRIPNQDGINYTVRAGDTLDSIAERHQTSAMHISTANELFGDAIRADMVLFIPGARMDWVNRQEINGDLFIWPTSGRISSPYGWRLDPFGSGRREFHTGIDIGAPHGTPILAAMSGRITQVGYNTTFGNFIIISHHSGYRTLYAHLSVVRVRAGAQVATGQRIGDVGSTGLSTGPHLHFTVYKDGALVNPRTLMR